MSAYLIVGAPRAPQARSDRPTLRMPKPQLESLLEATTGQERRPTRRVDLAEIRASLETAKAG